MRACIFHNLFNHSEVRTIPQFLLEEKIEFIVYLKDQLNGVFDRFEVIMNVDESFLNNVAFSPLDNIVYSCVSFVFRDGETVSASSGNIAVSSYIGHCLVDVLS